MIIFASWQFPHIFHNEGITRLVMDDTLVSQREQKIHVRTTKTSIKENNNNNNNNLVVAKCSFLPRFNQNKLGGHQVFFQLFTLEIGGHQVV